MVAVCWNMRDSFHFMLICICPDKYFFSSFIYTVFFSCTDSPDQISCELSVSAIKVSVKGLMALYLLLIGFSNDCIQYTWNNLNILHIA